MLISSKTITTAAIAALLSAAVAVSPSRADEATLKRLLPAGKAVRAGWAQVPRSFVYGTGNGLTAIYDGGFQMYLDRGVIEAAQVGYQSKAGYVSLAAHTMKSPDACAAFYDYWRKEAA